MNELVGSVLNYDGISILCEVYAKDEVIPIRLPRSLFPESIWVGLPFSLEIDESLGTRQAVVCPRKIDMRALLEDNNRLAALVESLPRTGG